MFTNQMQYALTGQEAVIKGNSNLVLVIIHWHPVHSVWITTMLVEQFMNNVCGDHYRCSPGAGRFSGIMMASSHSMSWSRIARSCFPRASWRPVPRRSFWNHYASSYANTDENVRFGANSGEEELRLNCGLAKTCEGARSNQDEFLNRGSLT
jgi:hypothetical protein